MNLDHSIAPDFDSSIETTREVAIPSQHRRISLKVSDRIITAGFGISLSLLGIVGVLFYFSVQELIANQRRTERTRSTLAVIHNITSNIKEAELGRRGYLLTGQAEFLRDFQQTMSSSETNFDLLYRFMKDRPLQQERLELLRPSFTTRLALFKTLLNRPIDQAEQIRLTSQSWTLRQKIESQFKVIRESEENSLFRHSRAIQSSVHSTLFFGGMGALFSGGLLGSIYLLLTREVQRRRTAESKLSWSNQQLEDRVRKRTETLEGLINTLRTEIAEHDRAEKELREQELRSQLMFEQHPQPMWIYDLETLQFLAVNQTAIQLYGYSRQEFLTKTLPDLYAPGYRTTLLQTIVSLIAEGYHRTSQETYGTQGRLLSVISTSRLIKFHHHNACLVMINPVAEESPATTISSYLLPN
jgi:PAS domain S-box-containing protein